MKTFKDLNYYEILKVPTDADAAAVQRAYRDAIATYDEDSLVTYCLFSDEERTHLLQCIDEAFHTLIDEEKRMAYDRALLPQGRIDNGVVAPKPAKAQVSAPAQAGSKPISKHRDLQSWVSKKAREEKIKRLIDDIGGQEVISGSDLKKLRHAFEIDLAEIFGLTRISKSTLIMIENDQFDELPADIFLRAFLKSYAEILQIDAQRVIEGYFNLRVSASPPRS